MEGTICSWAFTIQRSAVTMKRSASVLSTGADQKGRADMLIAPFKQNSTIYNWELVVYKLATLYKEAKKDRNILASGGKYYGMARL